MRPAPPPPAGIEPEDMPLTVRYEDEHLLVVDKPAGVVVHPAPATAAGRWWNGLAARDIAGGPEARPGSSIGLTATPRASWSRAFGPARPPAGRAVGCGASPG